MSKYRVIKQCNSFYPQYLSDDGEFCTFVEEDVPVEFTELSEAIDYVQYIERVRHKQVQTIVVWEWEV